MKKLILLASFCIFTLCGIAQSPAAKGETKKSVKQEYKYCAKLKDGLVVMMEGDRELTMEIVLANGTRIKPNATVTKPDGTVIILEDGECIDEAGNVFPAHAKVPAKDKTGKGNGKVPQQK